MFRAVSFLLAAHVAFGGNTVEISIAPIGALTERSTIGEGRLLRRALGSNVDAPGLRADRFRSASTATVSVRPGERIYVEACLFRHIYQNGVIVGREPLPFSELIFTKQSLPSSVHLHQGNPPPLIIQDQSGRPTEGGTTGANGCFPFSVSAGNPFTGIFSATWALTAISPEIGAIPATAIFAFEDFSLIPIPGAGERNTSPFQGMSDGLHMPFGLDRSSVIFLTTSTFSYVKALKTVKGSREQLLVTAGQNIDGGDTCELPYTLLSIMEAHRTSLTWDVFTMDAVQSRVYARALRASGCALRLIMGGNHARRWGHVRCLPVPSEEAMKPQTQEGGLVEQSTKRIVQFGLGERMTINPLSQSSPEITAGEIFADGSGFRYTYMIRNNAGLPIAAVNFRSLPILATWMIGALDRRDEAAINGILSNPDYSPPAAMTDLRTSDSNAVLIDTSYAWVGSDGLPAGADPVEMSFASRFLPGVTKLDVHSATPLDETTAEPDPATDRANMNLTGTEILLPGPAFERSEGLAGLRKNIRQFRDGAPFSNVRDLLAGIESTDETAIREILNQVAYSDVRTKPFVNAWMLALDSLTTSQ